MKRNKIAAFFEAILHYCKNKLSIFLYCLLALSFSSCYLICSFSQSASDEALISNISNLASNSNNNLASINLINKVNGRSFDDMNYAIEEAVYINNRIQLGDGYSVKPIIPNYTSSHLEIFELNNKKVTALLHRNSGKPHTNAKGMNIHYSYETALMFDSQEGNYVNQYNTTYICMRESDVKSLIGISNPTKEDYLFFIKKTKITILYCSDGQKIQFPVNISNIILDSYYDDVTFFQNYGTYIFINTFYKNCLPLFEDYAINFCFSNSVNDSSRYVSFIRNNLSEDDYSCSVDLSNLKNTDPSILECANSVESGVYNSDSKLSDVISILLSSLLFIVCFVLIVFQTLHYSRNNNWINISVLSIIFMLTYCIFFAINHLFNLGVLFFSLLSIKINLICFTIMVILYIITKKFKERPSLSNKGYYYRLEI